MWGKGIGGIHPRHYYHHYDALSELWEKRVTSDVRRRQRRRRIKRLQVKNRYTLSSKDHTHTHILIRKSLIHVPIFGKALAMVSSG